MDSSKIVIARFSGDAVVPSIAIESLSAESGVRIRAEAELGASVTLQASPDLQAWHDVPTVTNLSGALVLVDPVTPTAGTRFYRVACE